MGGEEGGWEEDGEGSDKKEHLTCVPGQEAAPGIDHAVEQLCCEVLASIIKSGTLNILSM